MGHLEGARVLDLFSGTGNLAIECLSRGAEWVDIVENHRKSLSIIRENLALLKLTEFAITTGLNLMSCLQILRLLRATRTILQPKLAPAGYSPSVRFW